VLHIAAAPIQPRLSIGGEIVQPDVPSAGCRLPTSMQGEFRRQRAVDTLPAQPTTRASSITYTNVLVGGTDVSEWGRCAMRDGNKFVFAMRCVRACVLVLNVLAYRQPDSTMCYRCVQLTQRTGNLLAAAIGSDEHRCSSGVGDAYAACPNGVTAAADEILLWSEYRNRLCVQQSRITVAINIHQLCHVRPANVNVHTRWRRRVLCACTGGGIGQYCLKLCTCASTRRAIAWMLVW
jgi:hypothetical protein